MDEKFASQELNLAHLSLNMKHMKMERVSRSEAMQAGKPVWNYANHVKMYKRM